MEHTTKIIRFSDLNAWKQGHQLVLLIYSITKSFPSSEQFGLSSQLRRAAVSVTSNIAEGFSRQSKKEKIQFYFNSIGSVSEIQNQILIAKDLNYITPIQYEELIDISTTVHKLLNGLVKSIRITL